MSNEIARIEKLQTSEIMSTAKAFFESGMFADIKSAAQAVVKIQAGQEIGIPPFAAMSGIHIIQGKPTVGAGLIAARVKGSGKYDYRVVEQSDKACSIDFYQGKTMIGNSTFTIEDAKKAQTKNIDKFPRNMLFARAISNGVKWFTPDIFSGPVYTPEEMDGPTTEDVQHTEVPAVKVTVHDEVKPQASTKPAINEPQFRKLLDRIQDAPDTDAGAVLIDKAQTSFTFTDAQAEALVSAVSSLPIPA